MYNVNTYSFTYSRTVTNDKAQSDTTQPLSHKHVKKCSAKLHVQAVLTNIFMAVPSNKRDMILDPCYMS